ncbi:RNA-guided endonuclease InsQ/TnpB family protein [Parafrankia colletiae]|uniref:RNA-guided endonuclease InsQ/TnpB family protein n=1 Tax=Parafrankia colletiae TaxID=573497 RepID=UPI000E2ED946
MRRTFKFQLRPTVKQAAAFTAMLSSHRALYNAALQERRDAYRHPSRTTVRYGDQSAQLKEIRADDPDQARWSFSSQQATLRRLDTAMAAFFRRVKAGEKPGYPRFRGVGWFDTVTWPKDGDGCRWDSQPDHPTQTRVRLQGVGHVKVNQHRPVLGTVKTISVKREGCRWYVLLSCDDVPAAPLPVAGAVVGVDLGVVSLATTSDGRHIGNPRYLAVVAGRLARAQRKLARKKRGSARRRKAVARVAALHGTVRRQRLDLAHKTALGLVREHDLIAVEALRVGNMTRRAAPRPAPDRPGAFLPNGQAAKTGLNRSILDAGWGVFLAVLHAKAESAGRTVVEVPPANTSRTCAVCGHCHADNRRTQAVFACVACGYTAHADVNAAVNILRAGLARQAAQAA